MNPDELLAQIADLLGQYLSLGADTPVAPEAMQLMDAIQGAQGGDQGAPPEDPMAGGMPPDAGGGMPPPDAGGGPPMPDEMPMPDIAGMAPDQMPTSSPGRSPLRGASDM